MPATPEDIRALLIGGGGREHALAWKLRQSPRLRALFTSHPENPGLAALAEPLGFPFSVKESYRLDQFCDRNKVNLVVIGPEAPLAAGLADALAKPGRAVLGPGAKGAMLESSKAWSKQFMRSASIPTAEGRVFDDPRDAARFIESRQHAHVVKASGLAAGKGVVVAKSVDEALDAVERMMVRREFGDAGRQIVVEERMEGREVSVFALIDGRNILLLEPCQDHKRLRDGDQGPNTGGMGAYCPSPAIDDAAMRRIEQEIILPTVDALRRERIEFRGVLFVGLMLTHGGPKVLEFNVRFGDPECQALMTRLDADLADLLWRTAAGALDGADVSWDRRASCCVVLASEGYPENPVVGREIQGINDAAAMSSVTVFHAGTKRDDSGRVLTAGGRVLNVVALGETLADARDLANAACDKITFQGMHRRRDIGEGA